MRKDVKDTIIIIVNLALLTFFLVWNYKGKRMFMEIPGIPSILGTKPEDRMY